MSATIPRLPGDYQADSLSQKAKIFSGAENEPAPLFAFLSIWGWGGSRIRGAGYDTAVTAAQEARRGTQRHAEARLQSWVCTY